MHDASFKKLIETVFNSKLSGTLESSLGPRYWTRRCTGKSAGERPVRVTAPPPASPPATNCAGLVLMDIHLEDSFNSYPMRIVLNISAGVNMGF